MSTLTRHVAMLAVVFTGVLGCEQRASAPTGNNTQASAARPPALADAPSGKVTVYCGRKKEFVGSLLDDFKAKSGIDVEVRFEKTATLALKLQEEGNQSPADIYWAQDAGSLGAVAKAGLLAPLPDKLVNMVQPHYRVGNHWVATSGRARTLAYSKETLTPDALPKSIFDLTDSKWKNKVGWAPTNASFQAHVTAMRVKHGDGKTLQWLKAMKANGAKVYPKNTPIIQALADGEIELGLPNHYYLLRRTSKDANFPVAQTFFAPRDIGNLMNVAGVGVLKTSKNPAAAHALIAFLLGDQGQRHMLSANNEYPVTSSVPAEHLPSRELMDKLMPDVSLEQLEDLPGTQKLLQEAGLI